MGCIVPCAAYQIVVVTRELRIKQTKKADRLSKKTPHTLLYKVKANHLSTYWVITKPFRHWTSCEYGVPLINYHTLQTVFLFFLAPITMCTADAGYPSDMSPAHESMPAAPIHTVWFIFHMSQHIFWSVFECGAHRHTHTQHQSRSWGVCWKRCSEWTVGSNVVQNSWQTASSKQTGRVQRCCYLLIMTKRVYN